MNPKNVRRLINFATIVVVILLAAVAIYWYDLGILSNINALQAYIARLGIAGALFFMLIQVIQVVIPIIPGGVSTAAGVILFGPWTGFFTTTSVLQLARLSISILLGDLVSRCLLI